MYVVSMFSHQLIRTPLPHTGKTGCILSSLSVCLSLIIISYSLGDSSLSGLEEGALVSLLLLLPGGKTTMTINRLRSGKFCFLLQGKSGGFYGWAF